MNEEEIQQLLDNIRAHGNEANIAIAERRVAELRRLRTVSEAKRKMAAARKPPPQVAGACRPIGVR